ncbi:MULTISPECIES: hypothetical protein [Methylobacterium]|uniref:Uncharacterized protein n=1 Tax=Methylobacterium longum TaxID=767694 RepID=A0ABT8AS00_9HYPH|nr:MULTISPECIES: hypothetical protein [Methylobacterium]MCJ2102999.1 hypothetical protein [Methylobacterium sp. E-046]MDN3572628.1 hypothetical protein [Methylobacterium longum]GJE12442.1 hypothetical protein FOHLNKBM_3491 [Methylobacterium longum]
MTYVKEGVVTIVQESRFQLTDDNGVSHLFLLDRNAAAEPAQLAPLQARQARVRVTYEPARNLIGLVARSVRLLPPSQAR